MAGVQTGTARRERPSTAPVLAARQVTAGLGPSPLQYFVFDFHVSPDVMFDKIIKISVSGEQPRAGRPSAHAAPPCTLGKGAPLRQTSHKKAALHPDTELGSGAQAAFEPLSPHSWVTAQCTTYSPVLATSKNRPGQGS